MNRRSYLTVVGATLSFSLSGCVSVFEKGISDSTGGSRSLGESVSYRGVEVTPDRYTTSTSVTYDIADANTDVTDSAPDGATFLLSHLTVRIVGENKRAFPSRGAFGGSVADRINHFYKSEWLSPGAHEDIAKAFLIGEYRFPNYNLVLLDEDLSGSVSSGEASGWLINVLPKGFSPSETTIEVTWGSSSSILEENLKTFVWRFMEEAGRSPENASGSADSGSTTLGI